MSKVTFSTNKYVQDEIAKLRLELEQNTSEGMENIQQEHQQNIKEIHDEIDSLKTFDTESQRTIEVLENMEIYPATEFIL